MKKPEPCQVGVLIGSDSDLPVMKSCWETLKRHGIRSELRVLSAHRSPDACRAYVKSAAARGVQLFICAAGGAAHLAGLVAAHTICPVIAVPIPSSDLRGVDSLYASVQMPPGVPVATMAIGKFGASNAALLAVQILALGDPKLRKRLREHKVEMVKKVRAKNKRVQAELKTRAR